MDVVGYFECEAVAALVSDSPQLESDFILSNKQESRLFSRIPRTVASEIVRKFTNNENCTVPVNIEHIPSSVIGTVTNIAYSNNSNNTTDSDDRLVVGFTVTNPFFIRSIKDIAVTRVETDPFQHIYTSSDGFISKEDLDSINEKEKNKEHERKTTDEEGHEITQTIENDDKSKKDITGENELLSILGGVSLEHLVADRSVVVGIAMCKTGKRPGSVVTRATYKNVKPTNVNMSHIQNTSNSSNPKSTNDYTRVIGSLACYKHADVSKLKDDLNMNNVSNKRLHYSRGGSSDQQMNVRMMESQQMHTQSHCNDMDEIEVTLSNVRGVLEKLCEQKQMTDENTVRTKKDKQEVDRLQQVKNSVRKPLQIEHSHIPHERTERTSSTNDNRTMAYNSAPSTSAQPALSHETLRELTQLVANNGNLNNTVSTPSTTHASSSTPHTFNNANIQPLVHEALTNMLSGRQTIHNQHLQQNQQMMNAPYRHNGGFVGDHLQQHPYLSSTVPGQIPSVSGPHLPMQIGSTPNNMNNSTNSNIIDTLQEIKALMSNNKAHNEGVVTNNKGEEHTAGQKGDRTTRSDEMNEQRDFIQKSIASAMEESLTRLVDTDSSSLKRKLPERREQVPMDQDSQLLQHFKEYMESNTPKRAKVDGAISKSDETTVPATDLSSSNKLLMEQIGAIVTSAVHNGLKEVGPIQHAMETCAAHTSEEQSGHKHDNSENMVRTVNTDGGDENMDCDQGNANTHGESGGVEGERHESFLQNTHSLNNDIPKTGRNGDESNSDRRVTRSSSQSKVAKYSRGGKKTTQEAGENMLCQRDFKTVQTNVLSSVMERFDTKEY